jgi:uncharacterized membrane protein
MNGTSRQTVPSASLFTTSPALRPGRVAFDAPWAWLAAGWSDLWTMPAISLTYGIVFAIAAAVQAVGLWMKGAHALFLVLAGGFLLVAPLLAVGLYEMSRRLQRRERVRLREIFSAGFHARGQLSFFGVMLLLMFFFWINLAFLLLMLFLGDATPPPANEFVQALLFTPRGLGLLAVGSALGAVLAAIAFAASAIAVPMLLVEEMDAVTAARTSIAAVRLNAKPMALWAGLIVVLIAGGFATLLIGLVIAFPLIGHATWHAYRDIMKR